MKQNLVKKKNTLFFDALPHALLKILSEKHNETES